MRDTAIESSVVTKVKGFGRYANRVMDVSDYVTPPQVRCPTLGTSGESGDRRADLLSQKLQYCWGELDIKKLDFPSPRPCDICAFMESDQKESKRGHQVVRETLLECQLCPLLDLPPWPSHRQTGAFSSVEQKEITSCPADWDGPFSLSLLLPRAPPSLSSSPR